MAKFSEDGRALQQKIDFIEMVLRSSLSKDTGGRLSFQQKNNIYINNTPRYYSLI